MRKRNFQRLTFCKSRTEARRDRSGSARVDQKKQSINWEGEEHAYKRLDLFKGISQEKVAEPRILPVLKGTTLGPCEILGEFTKFETPVLFYQNL